MDVPWARSFFEEGMEKGMEKGRQESLEEGVAALKAIGIPQEAIDAWLERMRMPGAHKPNK
jgi:flagellar biosynthesis/type III secretory pathway protein FliH